MSTPEIPFETYRILEQKVQGFRRRIIKVAGDIATHEHRNEVILQDILCALDSDLVFDDGQTVGKAKGPKIPQGVQLFLDGQIHRVRVLVASVASMHSRNPTAVTIESAWEEIRTNRLQLMRALKSKPQVAI